MIRILALAMIILFTAQPVFAADKESTYNRVMKTGTLRCGYVISQDAVEKDPNTGAMSGIIYEAVEKAGKMLNIKIDWSEELGWGTTIEAIRAGRVDAICTNFWMNPAEAKHLGFTVPLYFSAVAAYVKQGDTRFDKDIAAANDPAVKISGSDGEMATIIAAEQFPKATIHGLPNMTDASQQLTDVANGKADITFVDIAIGNTYIASNPGKLKNVTPQNPVRLFANTIALPIGDASLKSLLDAAFLQLIYAGEIDRLIKKYEKHSNSYMPVAKPYEVKQ